MSLPPAILEAVRRYVDARVRLEELEPEMKRLNIEFETAQHDLATLVADAGLTSLNTEDFGRFTPGVRGPFPNLEKQPLDGVDEKDWPVSETYREGILNWATDNGVKDELFKFMLVYPRFASVLGQILKGKGDYKDLPMPPTEFRYTPTITWTRPPHMKKT